jgi:hypothetical protein
VDESENWMKRDQFQVFSLLISHLLVFNVLNMRSQKCFITSIKISYFDTENGDIVTTSGLSRTGSHKPNGESLLVQILDQPLMEDVKLTHQATHCGYYDIALLRLTGYPDVPRTRTNASTAHN